MNKFLLIVLLATSPQLTTCEGPTTYYDTTNSGHIYEATPSIQPINLYCYVHEDIELVYRITPNIKDVEGSVSSTTNTTDSLQSFMSIEDLIFFDAIPIIVTENDSAPMELYFFDAEAEHPYYDNR